jgi:hypothetical protein
VLYAQTDVIPFSFDYIKCISKQRLIFKSKMPTSVLETDFTPPVLPYLQNAGHDADLQQRPAANTCVCCRPFDNLAF